MYWFVHLFNHLKLFFLFSLAALLTHVFVLLSFKEEFLFFFCYPYFYMFLTVQVVVGSISKMFSVYLYLILVSIFTFTPSAYLTICYLLLSLCHLNPFSKWCLLALVVPIIFLPVLVYTIATVLFYALYSFLPTNYYLLSFVFDLGPTTFVTVILGLYTFLILLLTVVLINFFGPFDSNHVAYVRVFSFFFLSFFLVLFLPPDPFTHFTCFFFFGLGLEISLFYRSLIAAYNSGRVA